MEYVPYFRQAFVHKGQKDRIVPGSKPCRFTDDMSGSPFITADTCQKLLVPDTLFACNNFIFNFFSTRKATSFSASSRN